MKIRFIGAAHEVTGSCTLLEVLGKYYLIDCGMEQGANIYENEPLPVMPSDIEAVFLTHAHIDHSGMLPKLYKDGFRGSIYATDVTCDLCNIMLRDSAHIQESEAQWQTRKALRAGGEPVEPVYSMQDAEGTIGLFRRCNYTEMITPAEGIELRFTDVGHLLGSACIELWLTEGETKKKIVFSGDVGNTNQFIICDPKHVEQTDYLVIESTYGNRLHEESEGDVISELAGYIQKALDRGGNVIIPSFAVGRTQEMLYAIREIKQRNLVHGHDGFPVYVDSPLASEATDIFMQCNPICFDSQTLAILNEGVNPIWFSDIRLALTLEESKQINMTAEPKVILSASGMCDAGRVRHHLKHNLWEKKNIILFVGYQADGTLGRKLLQGAKEVKLFGETIAVEAEIGSLHGTSGHADQKGLLNWLGEFKDKPHKVFINHGDTGSCETFCELLKQSGYDAFAPFSGTEFDLAEDRITIRTEGVPVDRKSFKTKRAIDGFNDLVRAAEELLSLVKTRRGMPNKENAKLKGQIRSLIDKWK